ncbi:MAG: hypothetical protein AAFW81_05605, partial [Pseudomonadota bacterium]
SCSGPCSSFSLGSEQDLFVSVTKIFQQHATSEGMGENGAAFEGNADIDMLGAAAIDLTHRQASSFDQLLCKIKLWYALAPDDQLSSEEASVDGKLLLSILSDVEQMGRRQR